MPPISAYPQLSCGKILLLAYKVYRLFDEINDSFESLKYICRIVIGGNIIEFVNIDGKSF